MTTQKERGRPSLYTGELADEICRRLAEGESLSSICKGDDMPAHQTVLRWSIENREGFSDKYTRAREAQYLRLADELVDIADDGKNDWMTRKGRNGEEFEVFNKEAAERSKLRVETRKWILSKMLPKVYGDKITNEITGSLAVSDAIDRPPRETREEWTARRRRELGTGAGVGTSTGTTDGSNKR